jgi:hypothetical protein
MRSDMDKVIVERPRNGRSWASTGRGKHKLDPDLPQIGLKKSVKIRGPFKMLNENLSPLRRYLASQAGRPWNKVWSDICAHLKPSSTVQQHVRDHIEDFVALRAEVRDGETWVMSRNGTPRLLSDTNKRLYVDPRTGLLRKNAFLDRHAHAKNAEAAAKNAAIARRRKDLGPLRQAHMLNDGAWWEVTLAPIPFTYEQVKSKFGGYKVKNFKLVRDVVLAPGLSDLSPDDLYGLFEVYAVAKRQLSGKEARDLGLR